MEDSLIEIDNANWKNLQVIYSPETSKTIIAFNTINNYIRWIIKNSSIDNLKMYSLNGDWSDGTFVVIDRYHVYFDTINESNGRMLRLLQLLDYSNGFRFMHVPIRLYPILLEIIKQKRLQLEYDDPNRLYYLPREKALSLTTDVLSGFCCGSLQDSDIAQANAEWPFKHPGSLFYLQRLAALNPNCGIFTENDNKLVSWIFQLQTGLLGTLQTDLKYQNRGLATYIVKDMCRQIGEMGSGITACTKRANKASRVFEKLGFEIIDEVHWIATTPCIWNDKY